jgi:hypothetical protein
MDGALYVVVSLRASGMPALAAGVVVRRLAFGIAVVSLTGDLTLTAVTAAVKL